MGRYLQKLIEYLPEHLGDGRCTVFLRSENWDEYNPPDARFKKVRADVAWYSVAEQVQMPRIVGREGVDLLHVPHYNISVLYGMPLVVTIHDLIVSHYPTVRATTKAAPLYWLKHLAYTSVIKTACHRAKKIITVSEFSKEEIIKEFHVLSEKVAVTYEAADPLPQGAPSEEFQQKIAGWRPYALYVGNAYPHKNLEELLVAWKEALPRLKEPAKLVLVGKPDYFYDRLQARANELHLQDSVMFAGGVSDLELAALYRNAKLFVTPSLEEGFGLPPLEAMQEGVPVASSNVSALPEILGDAALYMNPRSASDMADAIVRALEDEALRKQLRERGLQQAARFQWRDLARTTMDVYTDVYTSLTHHG